MIVASFIGNILNYIFNAYLGRILDFSDFALIGLIGALLSFASIFFGAYSTTANYRGSFLIGKYGSAAGYSYWAYARKKTIALSIIITLIWILLTPFLMDFFNTDNYYLFILFGIVLLVGFINSVDRGFLAAKLMFGSIAATNIVDPLIKLLVVVILVFLGLKLWAFLAIPISVFIIFIFSWLLIAKQVRREKNNAPSSEIQNFSKKFFFLSLMTGFSSAAVFTVDILLANHFLTPTEAGKYTLLSLIGKIIFFLGNLTQPFIIPLASRDKGKNRSSLKTLYVLLLMTSLLSLIGFIALGIFGSFTAPLLFGDKATAVLPYLLLYTFGMACYTISRVFISYYLVLELYTFTIATSSLVFLMIGLIYRNHSNAGSIAMVMTVIFILDLLLAVILHLGVNHIKKLENKLSKLFKVQIQKKTRFAYLRKIIFPSQI